MASQIQELKYEGYLCADPEMKYLETGVAVTNFRIGSTYQWKDKGGETHKVTTWLKVAAFGALGEIVNSICAKGSWVIVTGRLRPDSETGNPGVFQKQSGEAGATYDVIADKVRILKGKDFEKSSSQDDYGDLPY